MLVPRDLMSWSSKQLLVEISFLNLSSQNRKSFFPVHRASGQLQLSDVLWTFIFILSSDIWTSSSNTSDTDKHNPESQDKLSQLFRVNGSEEIFIELSTWTDLLSNTFSTSWEKREKVCLSQREPHPHLCFLFDCTVLTVNIHFSIIQHFAFSWSKTFKNPIFSL